jgi:hypothetical protein
LLFDLALIGLFAAAAVALGLLPLRSIARHIAGRRHRDGEEVLP